MLSGLPTTLALPKVVSRVQASNGRSAGGMRIACSSPTLLIIIPDGNKRTEKHGVRKRLLHRCNFPVLSQGLDRCDLFADGGRELASGTNGAERRDQNRHAPALPSPQRT